MADTSFGDEGLVLLEHQLNSSILYLLLYSSVCAFLGKSSEPNFAARGCLALGSDAGAVQKYVSDKAASASQAALLQCRRFELYG